MVFEQFAQRRFVVEIVISGALRVHRGDVRSKHTVAHGGAIHHSNHAIDRHTGSNIGPGEGADQWLGQGEARSLDHDVIWRIFTVQKHFHRRDEIVCNGAADAAVR